ncbi:hypothetical protein [Kitasatospora sp. NPDC093806]|uniref:hypothetical protein n=1 Tax=Kitasatospora sp. NPDC093806 TaxID=3155075 RepID=UPI00342A5488
MESEREHEPALRIPLAELRRALDVLVRHVAASSPDGLVTVEDEAYWSVPPTEAGKVDDDPPELTIGLLSESWEHLEQMIEDEDRTIGYGLVWLGDVLRAIGATAI